MKFFYIYEELKDSKIKKMYKKLSKYYHPDNEETGDETISKRLNRAKDNNDEDGYIEKMYKKTFEKEVGPVRKEIPKGYDYLKNKKEKRKQEIYSPKVNNDEKAIRKARRGW